MSSYLITSVENDAQLILWAARRHWRIEHSLHGVLALAFCEDECRVRQGHAAEYFAVLRHIAINLLQQDTSAKVGIKAKRLKAAREQDHLPKVLSIWNAIAFRSA